MRAKKCIFAGKLNPMYHNSPGQRLIPPTPLLLPALCIVAGMVAGQQLPPSWPVPLLFGGAVVLTLLLGRRPMAQSVAIGVCCLLLGAARTPTEQRWPDGVPVQAVVASVPADKPRTLMVDLLLCGDGEHRRCYIWKDERSRQLQLGHAIVVTLHDQQFVGRNDWQPAGGGQQQVSAFESLRLKALGWRAMLMERLKGSIPDEEQTGLLMAMTLGDKSLLSAEVRESFNVAGVAHVLALSGLHLSIVYMLLTMLVPPGRRTWMVAVPVVICIWAFTLLTGLSMSLVRAATMLTVYTLFSLGERRGASLNVLCFTAIVMLIVSPASLTDVGFQLSFMSLLGILLFTPLFSRLVPDKWKQRHQVLTWIGGMMAVTLSAQLGTAPIVAYYFGRFPTWFLLTNLVAVPATTLILAATLLTLIVPAVGSIAAWLSAAFTSVLAWFANLPMASIGHLHPSVLQVVLCYVAVALFWLLMVRVARSRSNAGYI